MKNFKLFIIFIIFLALPAKAVICLEASDEGQLSVQKSQSKDVICLKVKDKLPIDLEKQRSSSLSIMKPYFKTKVTKIVVVWQSDEFSYGKSFALSRVYIKSYLNKKTSSKELLSLINIDDVLPATNRYNIKKIPQNEISEPNLIRATELKKAADLYYLEGLLAEAQRTYSQCLELNPYDYISIFRLGEICKSKGETQEAEKYFIKSLEINPDFSAADRALYDIRKEN